MSATLQPNQYPLTPKIEAQWLYFSKLKSYLDKVFDDKKVEIKDKVFYLRETCEAEASFWNTIYKTYSDLKPGMNIEFNYKTGFIVVKK